MMELKRWREVRGIPVTLEPKHFPCDDTAATRLVIAAKLQGKDAHKLSLELARALWEREETLANPATISAAAQRAGLDAAELRAGAPPDVQLDALHEQFTKEALAVGVFGAPSFVLPSGEIFWGQDRLELLERALKKLAYELPRARAVDIRLVSTDNRKVSRFMSEKEIRVGLIGAGGNTKALHIPGFAKQDGVQIVAVANRTRESSQRVADEFAIPKVHDHWQALLEDASIDAVCIGTWPYMHAPLTIAALEAGKHVLCEARMAMDHSEARAMLAASLRHPALTAQIVPAPHTLAFDRTIIEMIAGGYIGELISIDARIAAARSYPDGSAPQHWRQNRVILW